jgi:hypothetical protein
MKIVENKQKSPESSTLSAPVKEKPRENTIVKRKAEGSSVEEKKELTECRYID